MDCMSRTDVVHEDVGVRHLRDQRLGALRSREIGSNAGDIARGGRLPHLRESLCSGSSGYAASAIQQIVHVVARRIQLTIGSLDTGVRSRSADSL